MNNSAFKTFRRKIKYNLIYILVKAIIAILAIVPKTLWLSACGTIGRLMFYCAPALRTQIISNLSLAFRDEKSWEEILSLTRNVFIMFCKNAGILLHGYTVSSLAGFRKVCVVKGEEYAKQAFDKGKGVIFLTAHIGPFESIATALSLKGYHPFIIGSRLKDGKLNNLVIQHRAKFGATVIERGKETFRVIKNIRSGGTAVMLIDQDTKVKSVFVDFFGESCSTPIGATLLALKTGAAIVPVFAHLREDGMQEIVYYPEVKMIKTGCETDDLIYNTQKFTSIIEAEIRKHPSQWVWMHKRWKTQAYEVYENVQA